jgi:hypothetical protein
MATVLRKALPRDLTLILDDDGSRTLMGRRAMSRLLAAIDDGALTAETDGSVIAVGGAVPTGAAGWLEIWFAVTAKTASAPVALVRAMRTALDQFMLRAAIGVCCFVRGDVSARLVRLCGFSPVVSTDDGFWLFAKARACPA